MKNMNDETLIPWGIHKGTRMIDVPASYLKWIHDNNKGDAAVRGYIEYNWDVILKQVKEEQNE